MRFAQTSVELPNAGARSRAAAISVASEAAPAANTTTTSPLVGGVTPSS
jgi:hypothetical protein